MELKITPSGQTIVKPTALGPGANTDTKLLIYGLFQKGRVLAQDGGGDRFTTCFVAKRVQYLERLKQIVLKVVVTDGIPHVVMRQGRLLVTEGFGPAKTLGSSPW